MAPRLREVMSNAALRKVSMAIKGTVGMTVAAGRVTEGRVMFRMIATVELFVLAVVVDDSEQWLSQKPPQHCQKCDDPHNHPYNHPFHPSPTLSLSFSRIPPPSAPPPPPQGWARRAMVPCKCSAAPPRTSARPSTSSTATSSARGSCSPCPPPCPRLRGPSCIRTGCGVHW